MPKLLYARPAADEQEQATIAKLARSRHAPAVLVARAKTIAMSWTGARTGQIAAGLGCHMQTARERIQRFNDEGVAGLFDRPGAGRKRRISQLQRGRILALARSTPPGRHVRGDDGDLHAAGETGAPQWTLNTLTEAARAEGIEVARSQVRRILMAENVRWQRCGTLLPNSKKGRDLRELGRTTLG